jgi:predicted nucleic acid-binding protein
MRDQAKVVITNTTPLIALTAATGSLDVLRAVYSRVIVPYEVSEEIRAGGKEAFGLTIFEHASWLEVSPAPVVLPPYLQNTLDLGDASVIQTALQLGVKRVCIDETIGRRLARLSNLDVTGSIGVLLKAKSMGYPVSMAAAIDRMRERGIWLSNVVIDFALTH